MLGWCDPATLFVRVTRVRGSHCATPRIRARTVSDLNPRLNPAPQPACSSARTCGNNRYRYLIRFNPASPPRGLPHPRRGARRADWDEGSDLAANTVATVVARCRSHDRRGSKHSHRTQDALRRVEQRRHGSNDGTLTPRYDGPDGSHLHDLRGRVAISAAAAERTRCSGH